MWPDREPWPIDSARLAYRQLKRFDVDTVRTALERLKGEHPPSPASLERKVAEVAAAQWAPYPRPALPAQDVGVVDRWLEAQQAGSVWEVVERLYEEGSKQ